MKQHGGLITLDDLQSYQAVWRMPLQGFYRGFTIHAVGPPTSGGVCLIETLNILENYEIPLYRHNSPLFITLVAEAEKRAFADRAKYLGDPDYVRMPVRELIAKDYAISLSEYITPGHTTPSSEISHGEPFGYEGTQTTHFSVLDAAGNAVSNTYTLNSSFGSKVVIEGAGFLMNNEMDDFSLAPGHANLYGLTGTEANAVAPKKRMLSSMSPTIVSKHGTPVLILGSRGGSRIITSTLQVILNVIDFEMDLDAAVGAPRFHHQWLPDMLFMEREGFSPSTRNELEDVGYKIKDVTSIGEVHAIQIDPETGQSKAVSDGR
jgi:gamma-glutamyltranspeptidase/glutathione hydrolase